MRGSFLPYHSFHIVDQTIAAIVSLVHNSKASAIVLIPECEEIVVKQIHLHDGFFPGPF